MQDTQHPLKLAIEELKQMPTIDIKGKSYTQVSTRVAVFRKYFPQASIITNILHDDPQRVVVQATISIDDKVVSTGLSEEFRGEGFINQSSALENSETSAIGRALAGLSLMGGSEYASSFEVVNAQEQQKHTNNSGYNHQQQNYQQSQNSNDHQQYNLPQNQQSQTTYQHSQGFSQLTNIGLTVMQQGEKLLVVGKNQFENKSVIRNAGFFWNAQNKVWEMPLNKVA